MKVCFIGKHQYPKDIFSNEQDLKTWRAMAKYFDRLFVIAQSPNWFFHRAKENNINIYLIPKIFGYMGFIIGTIKVGFYLHWKYKIHVFDASEVVGGGLAATCLKFLTGAQTVVEVQGEIFHPLLISEISSKKRLLQKIGRFVIKRADRIRTNSNAVFNQVKEQGISENKIRLVHLRVDLDLFNPLSILRINSGADDDKIKIGYIGRLVEGKGLEDLLLAMANFSAKGGPTFGWKILIFGNGPLEEKLKKIAEDLKINDKIEWRGFVPYNKVPEALSQIDVFVYPSLHEGFGRSIMEALAMERAVVATNIGGIPDLIKDGVNGFLVESNNPEMLAEKIKILMENKDLRERFGKAGRKWVRENFEWDEGIKKFASLFLELK
ncbi:MAG: glycosyltransferase family 4 protein [Candidatus Azambacteria bacterium]|nr:glycosyltransferase family 4 protein [Candidatus Azambacteria bacterium]